ncbi:MAG: hypothetical protein K9G39_02490 [Chlorobium sp.]|uniref:hypothetical protein n=1 Tax=Chlorobium sp. TaxID=1095 RepID=UPI0025C35193|nr:hypothetical protein [Chlorobium sp.]MCF8382453.1 hypothetical protein [Chlorobium sp.]
MIATGKDWTADNDVTIFQEFEVRKNRPHLKTEPQQICLKAMLFEGAREASAQALAVYRKVLVIFEFIGLQ